jgi:hypothetical protein
MIFYYDGFYTKNKTSFIVCLCREARTATLTQRYIAVKLTYNAICNSISFSSFYELRFLTCSN